MFKRSEEEKNAVNVSIVGRHLDLTEGLKNHIHHKVAKAEKIIQPIIEVHVTITVEKVKHIAEIILRTKGHTVKATGQSEDMYASVDMATSRLINHLRKIKEKRKDHHAKEPTIEEFIANEELESTVPNHPEVHIRRVEVMLMDIDEAILQLDALGQSHLIFRRGDTDQINVISKTSEGDYEILEPENA